MRLVHFAPFAPNRAGIYEAARDMVRADATAGHDVAFVDVGCLVGSSQEPPRVGAVDDRGGFSVTTASPSIADSADVLVCHTGVPDAWIARSQAPLVWVLHGRPLAAFRLEQATTRASYSLAADVARWPRSKALVHFWPEFTPYWSAVLPDEKTFALDFPPIDLERFSAEGDSRDGECDQYDIPAQHRGRINALICDSWREDVDVFDVLHGALEASRRIPGLTWHLFAIDDPSGPVRHLIRALGAIGALGEVRGRAPDMERVYRAMDFVLTPHRIVTRVIGEALACGTPVVAGRGCAVSDYTASPDDPCAVAAAVESLMDDLDHNASAVYDAARQSAERFALPVFSERMNDIYNAALGREAVESWR